MHNTESGEARSDALSPHAAANSPCVSAVGDVDEANAKNRSLRFSGRFFFASRLSKKTAKSVSTAGGVLDALLIVLLAACVSMVVF